MIICGGIFAQVLYNILASILRALGNSKDVYKRQHIHRLQKHGTGNGLHRFRLQ